MTFVSFLANHQFEFIQNLSQASENNTVIGLVRNKATADAKLRKENLNVKNLHVIEVNYVDLPSLKVWMHRYYLSSWEIR